MPVHDPGTQSCAADVMDGRVKPTAFRFNLVDVLHGIDYTGGQVFGDVLDTDEDQCHAE